MEKGDALLQAYAGPYVVESFHPMAMRWYRSIGRRCAAAS